MNVSEVECRFRSQHGEDGIIQYLINQLPSCSQTFFEIGCGNGTENNTTHLAENGWGGLVVDGKLARIEMYKKLGFRYVEAVCLKVSTENVLSLNYPRFPDLFSLDIDSIDYHVLKTLLSDGFRPSVMVLEYNAAFHLEPITVPRKLKRYDKYRYFGCGVMAWRKLLEPIGYTFVTVDSSGTNAFFTLYDKGEIETVEWLDCKKLAEIAGDYRERFDLVKHLPLEYV